MCLKVRAIFCTVYEIIPPLHWQNIKIMSTPHVCRHEGKVDDDTEYSTSSAVIFISCHSEAQRGQYRL